MAAPVWVLSVDLQAKTATFQSGMAEAAKSARTAFSDVRSGSGEMSIDVGRSMTESREGVILLGEAFGVHPPRLPVLPEPFSGFKVGSYRETDGVGPKENQ
jgi:hypothetical protein